MARSLLLGAAVICALQGCFEEPERADRVRFPEGEPFGNLSEYNLFEDPIASLTPKRGVVPYDLNAPLFSDHAIKQRFVYVPGGGSVPYDTADVLNFPVGTIVVKNFSYTMPAGEFRIIETRLLLRQSDGWNAEVYVWDEAQTGATRIIVGKEETISFSQDGEILTTNYQIPNKNQCKNCHARNNEIVPIGPKVANLNRTFAYDTGPENQIRKWIATGLLAAPHEQYIPKWPDYHNESEDLNLRARAYLEANCAHCHRREGAASNTGLYLEYYNYDSLSYGYYKMPVAAGEGSGNLRYNILPGDAEQSILHYRMSSTRVKVRMPELGRSLIDEKGVALIKEWIDSMK